VRLALARPRLWRTSVEKCRVLVLSGAFYAAKSGLALAWLVLPNWSLNTRCTADNGTAGVYFSEVAFFVGILKENYLLLTLGYSYGGKECIKICSIILVIISTIISIFYLVSSLT
jgi:hypothetical protein